MSRVIAFVIAFHVVTWALYETPSFLRADQRLAADMGE